MACSAVFLNPVCFLYTFLSTVSHCFPFPLTLQISYLGPRSFFPFQNFILCSFFPPTYTTFPLELFQHSFWTFGTLIPSASIHSILHHTWYVYLSLYFLCVTIHHILACCLHLPYSPHMPSTLRPITPVTKCQNSKPLLQITQCPSYSDNFRTLFSIPPFLASKGLIQQAFSG